MGAKNGGLGKSGGNRVDTSSGSSKLAHPPDQRPTESPAHTKPA